MVLINLLIIDTYKTLDEINITIKTDYIVESNNAANDVQWSGFVIESYARKENCEFTVLAQYQSEDGTNLIVRGKYKAININGQWELEEAVNDYDLVGKGYIEENGVMIIGHMEGEKLRTERPAECYK